MPAEERHVAAFEHGYLGGVLEWRIVSVRRTAGQRQHAGSIDVGKIGSDRLAVAVDHVVRHRDQTIRPASEMPSTIKA